HGPVAYRDHFELVWRHRAERANATWQADHTQLDILIVDANHPPVRPWLTVIFADYARADGGYMVFVGAASALTTAVELREGSGPTRRGRPITPSSISSLWMRIINPSAHG